MAKLREYNLRDGRVMKVWPIGGAPPVFLVCIDRDGVRTYDERTTDQAFVDGPLDIEGVLAENGNRPFDRQCMTCNKFRGFDCQCVPSGPN